MRLNESQVTKSVPANSLPPNFCKTPLSRPNCVRRGQATGSVSVPLSLIANQAQCLLLCCFGIKCLVKCLGKIRKRHASQTQRKYSNKLTGCLLLLQLFHPRNTSGYPIKSLFNVFNNCLKQKNNAFSKTLKTNLASLHNRSYWKLCHIINLIIIKEADVLYASKILYTGNIYFTVTLNRDVFFFIVLDSHKKMENLSFD